MRRARLLLFACASAGAILLTLAACWTTRRTVARLATPTPGAAQIAVEPSPETPTATAVPARSPTPTPTIAGLPVERTPASSIYDRTPGVLQEQSGKPPWRPTPTRTALATRAPA